MKNKKISQSISSSFKDTYPEWAKKNQNVISISNYDSFYQEGGEFTRNFTPYSVLPLSAKNCVRLMMGHLWIMVIVDTSVIKDKLIKAGWEVSKCFNLEDISDSIPNADVEEPIAQRVEHEKYFEIKKGDEDGTFTGSLLATEIMIAMSTFYGFDFLVDLNESSYQEAKLSKRSEYVTRNYVGERKVLV